MPALSDVARTALERRILRQYAHGTGVEMPDELFQRVAGDLVRVETRFCGDMDRTTQRSSEGMSDRSSLPNSPTLMNVGTELGQLAACFVLPLPVSLSGIFERLKNTVQIHQSGGGTGFSFARLRPEDDVVQATGGVASGPVGFMRVFDAATEHIKQGGRRRGC